MKKVLYALLLLITPCFCTHAWAQFAYGLTTLSQAYVPLTGDTDITGGHVWRGDSADFAITTGFNFQLDTITCSQFYFLGANQLSTDPSRSIISGFNATETNLIDRGMADSMAKSPVRMSVTGTAGHRIVKAEVWNAGFLEEYKHLQTLGDSACLQIWLYEGTNVVEIHYGPSYITHPSLYFAYGLGPLVFYVQDNIIGTYQNGPIYVLAGNTTGPVIEPNTITDGQIRSLVIPLHSWPADSTVYRFTPYKTSAAQVAANSISVYPTYAHDEIKITGAANTTFNYHVVAVNGAATGITGTFHTGAQVVDISALPQGMYLLQLYNDKGSTTQKFVKL